MIKSTWDQLRTFSGWSSEDASLAKAIENSIDSLHSQNENLPASCISPPKFTSISWEEAEIFLNNKCEEGSSLVDSKHESLKQNQNEVNQLQSKITKLKEEL